MSRFGTAPHRPAAISAQRRKPNQPPVFRLDAALPPILSILVGSSLSLLAVGFLEAAYRLLDDSVLTFQISVLAMSAVFAFGLRRPYRAALRAGPVVQRMLSPLSPSAPSRSPQRERPGHHRWTLAGGAALVTGLAALISPAIDSVAHGTVRWASENFCWMVPARIALEASILLAMAVIPFTCVGLLVRCVHHTWMVEDAASVHRWSWMLAGAAAGLGGLAVTWAAPPPPHTLFRSAAIPLLAAAILSVARTAPDRVRVRGVARTDPQEPDLDDPWPTVLRLGVGVAAGVAIVVGFNWAHVQNATHAGSHRASMLAGSALIGAFACGVAVAGLRRREANHRIGSFGAQVACVGAALAAGTTFFALVTRQSYAPFRETPGHALLWLVCAAVPLAALGHAVGYGVIAVGRRVTADDGWLCRIGQRIAVGLGAAAGLVAAPMLVVFGSYVSLVAASLALLACGGILLIHDPAYESSRRRRHVVSVFATVMVMTVLMPVAGHGWLVDRRFNGDVLEAWSGVYETDAQGRVRVLNAKTRQGPADGSAGLPLESVDWSAFSERPRVCIISHHGSDKLVSLPVAGARRRFIVEPAVQSASTERIGYLGQRAEPLRSLWCSRDRYDLILVSLMDVPPAGAARFLSAGRLRQLAGHLVADGLILVLAPEDSPVSADTAQLANDLAGGRPIHLELTEVTVGGRVCRAWVAGFESQPLANVIRLGEARLAERRPTR